MKSLVILFSIVFLTSCSNKEAIFTTCNTNNPLEELAWLKEKKETIDKIDCAGRSTITQYTYNSNTVFEVIVCSNHTDGQISIYNCKGEIICNFGGITGENTCPDFYDTATEKNILYEN